MGSQWKILKWLKLSENVPETILVGQCDHFNHWLLMKISKKNDFEHGVFWCIFLKMTDLLWKFTWPKIFESLVRTNGWVWSAKTFTDIRKYIKNQFWVGLEVGQGGPFFCSPLKDIFFPSKTSSSHFDKIYFFRQRIIVLLYTALKSLTMDSR